MYCRNCGSPMENTAAFCTRCGAAVAGTMVPVNPEMNQLAQSVLTRSIVGLALAHFSVPFAGFIVSRQAKQLHNDYIARGGANVGKAKVGRILANIGFPLGIVSTVSFFVLILYMIIWCLAVAGIVGAGMAGYL